VVLPHDQDAVGGRLEGRAEERYRGAQLLFGALVRGDVLPHAVVAPERAAVVEHRLAADRQVAHDAIRIQPRKFEFAERLVSIEHRAMRRPSGRVRSEMRNLPPGLADQVARGIDRLMPRSMDGLGHAVAGIRLPIEVGRELDQAAETLFAFPPRLLRLGVIAGLDPSR
jgi:hypothetical protein